MSTTAPNAICNAPFAGGGLAVNVTVGPAEAFSVPTPPPTVQLKLTPGTGLLYTSNAWPENGCVSNGRSVTLFGETATRVTGPGETTIPPLNPMAGANEANMRIDSAFVYVSVARVAEPPERMLTVVVPRMPPPGVTPSRRRAAKATAPVQLMIVTFNESLAVTVTVNAAPVTAVANA
ncbi:MAG: hypothetical protein E6K18_08955, partial [Methanobacteriota archaeon]